jgi:hypothetical protein
VVAVLALVVAVKAWRTRPRADAALLTNRRDADAGVEERLLIPADLCR